MQDKNYFLSLLDYNSWANDEFFKVIVKLPELEVTKQRQSFMNSIRNSLNHLLVIDKVWLANMKKQKHDFNNLQTILFENTNDLWEEKKIIDNKTYCHCHSPLILSLQQPLEHGRLINESKRTTLRSNCWEWKIRVGFGYQVDYGMSQFRRSVSLCWIRLVRCESKRVAGSIHSSRTADCVRRSAQLHGAELHGW